MVLMVLRLLANTFVSQKIESFIFSHAPKQNTSPGSYHYPPSRGKLPIPPEQRFLGISFFRAEGGLWSAKNDQN